MESAVALAIGFGAEIAKLESEDALRSSSRFDGVDVAVGAVEEVTVAMAMPNEPVYDEEQPEGADAEGAIADVTAWGNGDAFTAAARANRSFANCLMFEECVRE